MYGIRFNKTENVLRKFLRDEEGNLRGILGKGTWFLEWSRSGRWLNESNTFGGVDNLGPNKKTKIRTPNIKLRYSSASENPAWDNADKESIGDVAIIQKGGFQRVCNKKIYCCSKRK